MLQYINHIVVFLYAILNEENLKNAVRQCLFLNITMKQQILEYFERLSEKQKWVIRQGIQAEKSLMLNFLKQLKNKPEIKVSQIQEYYKKHYVNTRRNTECTEELQKQEELENLLLELEDTF